MEMRDIYRFLAIAFFHELEYLRYKTALNVRKGVFPVKLCLNRFLEKIYKMDLFEYLRYKTECIYLR